MKSASFTGEASGKKMVHVTVEPEDSSPGGRVASTSFAADQAAVAPFSANAMGSSMDSDSFKEVEMPQSRFSQQVRALRSLTMGSHATLAHAARPHAGLPWDTEQLPERPALQRGLPLRGGGDLCDGSWRHQLGRAG